MQGAPKRTSGRSHPWSAPLRATSSVSYISTWCAILKLHKMHGCRIVRFVGIALRLERFTSAGNTGNSARKNRSTSAPAQVVSSGNSCITLPPGCECRRRLRGLARELSQDFRAMRWSREAAPGPATSSVSNAPR